MTELDSLPHIAASDVPDVALRRCLTIWHEQYANAGPLPPERSIDPFAVPELAGSVILYDVAQDLELRFRVVGEDVKERVGKNPVGLPPTAIIGNDAYGQFIVAQLRHCARIGLPLYSHHDFRAPGDEMVRLSARIAMPYGKGQRVTKLLCFQKFSAKLRFRDEDSHADWNVVTLALVDRI